MMNKLRLRLVKIIQYLVILMLALTCVTGCASTQALRGSDISKRYVDTDDLIKLPLTVGIKLGKSFDGYEMLTHKNVTAGIFLVIPVHLQKTFNLYIKEVSRTALFHSMNENFMKVVDLDIEPNQNVDLITTLDIENPVMTDYTDIPIIVFHIPQRAKYEWTYRFTFYHDNQQASIWSIKKNLSRQNLNEIYAELVETDIYDSFQNISREIMAGIAAGKCGHEAQLAFTKSYQHVSANEKTKAKSQAVLPEQNREASLSEQKTFSSTSVKSAAGGLSGSFSEINRNDLGNYHALVIGNNKYRHLPKLETASNDAEAVADVLKNSYGFQVKLLIDAKREDIINALASLRETLTKKDNLLIYYAGHGWLDKEGDEGYWLPVDATKENELNWISNASITTTLRAMEAKHVLVVADSCYSGKLARGVSVSRKIPDYYSMLSNKRARSVLVSGALEPIVSSSNRNDHSIFASAFLNVLNRNTEVVEGSELFNRMNQLVQSDKDIILDFSDIRRAGHDGGDFLFVRN
jgi:Caspase domain